MVTMRGTIEKLGRHILVGIICSTSFTLLFTMDYASSSKSCFQLRQLVARAQSDEAVREQLAQSSEALDRAAHLLLMCNNDVNAAFLHALFNEKGTDIRSLLSDSGADIVGMVMLNEQIKSDMHDVVRRAIIGNNVAVLQGLSHAQLLPDKIRFMRTAEEMSPLGFAIIWKKFEALKCLLACNKNSEPHALLCIAIRSGDSEAVRLLLHDERLHINAQKLNGCTALQVALENFCDPKSQKNKEILAEVLQHPQIDPNIPIRHTDEYMHNRLYEEYTYTPLLLAIQMNNAEAVRLLLQHPAIDTQVVVNYAGCKKGAALEYAQELQESGRGRLNRANIITLLTEYECKKKRQRERLYALLMRRRMNEPISWNIR